MTSVEQPSGMRWPVLDRTAAATPGGGAWHVEPLAVVVPRDSRELLPLHVTQGGTPVTAGLRVSVTRRPNERDWQPVISAAGVVGFRPGGAPGSYYVAVKHAASGAVMDAGRIILT